MNLPALVSVSATVPLFAVLMGDDAQGTSDDLLVVVYVAAVGLLISFAALLDDALSLTAWFGLVPGVFETF
jgi:hypothetical protein